MIRTAGKATVSRNVNPKRKLQTANATRFGVFLSPPEWHFRVALDCAQPKLRAKYDGDLLAFQVLINAVSGI